MADLAYVLRQLPPSHDPKLLVGSNLASDAAVYRIGDDLALIQTVDFFTPIVDDPYLYGQIAAANSLSDVYAMGGSPLTALNIAAFPVKSLPVEILAEILRGGADKAAEAGVPIVGGHTIDDGEPKYGLAVTGTVHPERFVTSRGARPGDRLVLTKPIGTGLISTALKAGKVATTHLDQAVRWMTTLNRGAAQAMVQAQATAATDITGYGLLGHLVELCKASQVAAELHAGSVPLLPGALEYARAGNMPGGTWTNLDHIKAHVHFDAAVEDDMQAVLADPQTSGGLLVALSPAMIPVFTASMPPDVLAVEIGRLVEGAAGHVTVLP